MASRYGRNKRRQQREQIAQLEARIDELLGPYPRALPGDFVIDEHRAGVPARLRSL